MKLTYDPEANVAYIRLREAVGEVESWPVGDDVVLDLSADGELIGIELLNAKDQFGTVG